MIKGLSVDHAFWWSQETWTMIFLLKQRHLKLSNYVCDFMFIELKINSNNSVLQMHWSKSLNFSAFSINGPPRFLNYKGAGLLAVSVLTNILNLFTQYSKVKKHLAKGTIKYSKCMHILKKQTLHVSYTCMFVILTRIISVTIMSTSKSFIYTIICSQNTP